jgi:23S rRNA (adenine-N6)-dimethyltransferase
VAGRSNPAWGWYRLDRAWAERLVAASGATRGDLVLDIGAGDGALTAPLVDLGARVIAVELHPARAAALRRRFGDTVRVVEADAADLRLPRQAFRVVANPPWSITDPLLRRLLRPASLLVRADIILKRSATRRWAAVGRTRAHRLETGPAVPRHAFRPSPPIDGRVLIIRRDAQPESNGLRRSPNGRHRSGR